MNVQQSIVNTGNSLYKFFLILFLLGLIGIKKVGLVIKNLLDKIVFFFQSIFGFIVSVWRNIIHFLQVIWGVIGEIWSEIIEFIKYVHKNFLELLNLIWQFIRKVFFLAVVEEIGFYSKKLKDFSNELKENLSFIVKKLQDYSDYLSRRFEDKNVFFSSSIHKTYLSLSGNVLFWFLASIFFGVLSILMMLVLILGTIIGIPVLHQYIRKDIIGNNEK